MVVPTGAMRVRVVGTPAAAVATVAAVTAAEAVVAVAAAAVAVEVAAAVLNQEPRDRKSKPANGLGERSNQDCWFFRLLKIICYNSRIT